MKDIVSEAIHDKRYVVRYWKDLKTVARINRKNPTEAERKVWNEVLSKRKTGYLFLRQKPLYRFIADFYCSELCLVIEIDGDSHNKKKGTDEIRDKWLRCIGINTIRFTNDEVLNDIEKVRSVLKVSLVKGRFRGIER
ncbi:endonuclease domain-containing protein [Candidatus Shapirobacteria bacterium]|nr:endonuclease domain-containing protein [Candidatus Shapirobacteria bacterium]